MVQYINDPVIGNKIMNYLTNIVVEQPTADYETIINIYIEKAKSGDKEVLSHLYSIATQFKSEYDQIAL